MLTLCVVSVFAGVCVFCASPYTKHNVWIWPIERASLGVLCVC